MDLDKKAEEKLSQRLIYLLKRHLYDRIEIQNCR